MLDASALLAYLNAEPGSEQVEALVLDGSPISAVNLSEVIAKLARTGMPEAVVHEVLGLLKLRVVPFDEEIAYRSAFLIQKTRTLGLSLGDRACLALAQKLRLPAFTADRVWNKVDGGVDVRLIR